MRSVEVELDETDQKVLRFLERQPLHLSRVINKEDIIREIGMDDDHYVRMMRRFASYGFLECIGGEAEAVQVNSPEMLAEIVHKLDNQPKPPPPNRWEDFKAWAFSKWWIIPLMLLSLGLPWCVGVVTIVKLFLEMAGK